MTNKWQPQDIETIISSFEKYALGDILHNKSKPIAAFILSICFIDQISGFIYDYKEKHSRRAEKLISKYMKPYDGLGLYNYVRNRLIHNYSSEGKYDIDNVGNENVPYLKDGSIIKINTSVFIAHLEKAFENIKSDLRNNKTIQKNAKLTSIKFPVFVDTRK